MKEFTAKYGCEEDMELGYLAMIAEAIGGEGTCERIVKLGQSQCKIKKLMDKHQHIQRSAIKEYNKIISELYPEENK